MEIKIGKSAKKCAECEKSFEHNEQIHSVVRIEERILIRGDYCQACWTEECAKGAFSTWTPSYYDPKVAEAEPPEAFSPLRQAFYESVDAVDRCELAKAYLAAQLLRRQKVFRLIKASDDPDEELRLELFSDRIGNRLIEVRDPQLTHNELGEGRTRLMERLNILENPVTDEEEQTQQQETQAGEQDAESDDTSESTENTQGIESDDKKVYDRASEEIIENEERQEIEQKH